jgi:predicted membrane protein
MGCKDSTNNSAVISGSALIIFGGLLLLNQLGLIHDWFNFWATIFIFVGVLNIFQSQRSRPWGFLLVAAGLLIEFHQLGFIALRLQKLWPILLIAAGVVLVWRAFQTPDPESRSQDFRGGDLVAFMGGFDIDLREANIAGDQAVINVTALMGGGVLRIPENWAVSMQVGAFMGGHTLKTHENAQITKTLVIKGLAIMGGIEVRN